MKHTHEQRDAAMRTREQIIGTWGATTTNGKAARLNGILEVLLDIRDLLSPTDNAPSVERAPEKGGPELYGQGDPKLLDHSSVGDVRAIRDRAERMVSK